MKQRQDKLTRALGDVIKEQRNKRQMSQEEFSAKSGLHRTYISDIERGSRNLAVVNIARIAEAFEIPLHALFKLVDERMKTVRLA